MSLPIVAVLTLVAGCTIAQQSKPNILFIIVDDLGWTDISSHNAEYSTPNLDALITNGVEFTNYYVHLDCSPTRSSIITGKYSWKTGLENVGTIPPATTQHIPFDTPTMAEVMKSAGYSTHGLGKWHLGYAAWNMTPIGRGFDSYFGMFQGEQWYYNHTFEAPVGLNAVYSGFDFWDNKEIYYDAIGKYSNDLYEERVIQILNNANKDSKPFFIYMAFQTIHTPIEQPPRQFSTCDGIKNSMRKVYCNKMVYMDVSIGKFVDTLKQNGLYDNTLIALTTDNGGMPHWKPRQEQNTLVFSWGCNYPYRAGKATLFEGGVKGVGILSGALIEKKGLSGTKNNIMAHCSDWYATFLEGIAGTSLPPNIDYDSKNIWNYLGENATNWDRDTLYVNIDDYQNATLFAIIYNDTDTNTVWKYIEGQQMYTEYFYCNQTKYGPRNDTAGYWLFNLTADILETTNLMNVYPEIASTLRGKIEYQIQSGAFVPDQDRTMDNAGLPALHDGVWAPWLK